MSTRERLETIRLRIYVLVAVMVLSLGFLSLQLWRIQVLRADEFVTSLDRQSIRRVRLPGVRGRIYDRHGVILADNHPLYCIAIYTEELRQQGPWSRTIDKIDGVIDDLAQIMGRERQVTRADIQRHVQRRLPLPFLAWRGLDDEALARWAERGPVLPGVDIYIEPERVYPHGMRASHLLGYVGRADTASEMENPYHYYLPEMAGREGIERAADRKLRGRAGGRLIRVDASGFKFEETGELEPVPGEDIRLALDLRIQEQAEQILEGLVGAVVVLDPRNGDILALASGPAFDRTSLASRSAWQDVLSDPSRPVLNRAIAGQYPPGSIFKPLVGITGLVYERITPETVIGCPGFFEIGGIRFRCWLSRGHGPLALRSAIEQSCNPYFIDVGLRVGYQRIYHMAASVGFGHRTGIELPGEARGLLPDDAWKRRVHGDAWRPGDTCNVSIGQGALLVTPLQMAVFTAAIANGGRIYRPRLILDETQPVAVAKHRMDWPADSLDMIREGMQDAIHGPRGTGRRAFLHGIQMAGKTGTAQFGVDQTHAWMILFAPYESPRYAVAMIAEDEMSGGVTVAPLLQKLMRALFEMDGTLQAEPATASHSPARTGDAGGRLL